MSTQNDSDVDWERSIYMNISISNFNITNWCYDTGTAETGIMLVESIQNFKTYFSQIKFNSLFNVNVDFTRMYCSSIDCEPNNATYLANLTLQRMNMSISQRLSVPSKTLGILNTVIQSISLSLGQNDLNLNFPNNPRDFANTLNRTFESIKDYFLQNTNQLAQDQKKSVEALLQQVLNKFSVIRIPFLNNTLTLKPLQSLDNQGTNPIINSNYISTLMKVEVTTPDNVTDIEFDPVFLPIKEQGSGQQADLDQNQVQFIASQSLLVKLISQLWQSELFLKEHNPSVINNFISFNETSLQPMDCTMEILNRQFPKVLELFPGASCQQALWIGNVTDFTINTGRFYSVNKTLTVGMRIDILDAVDKTKVLFSFDFDIPLENLYVSFSLSNSQVVYQVYNFQPANFTLLKNTPESEGFSPALMMVYWNAKFKMPYLKYLNTASRQTFNLPPSAYNWISANVTKSFANFKFELYDKFAIMNLQPDYNSESLIWVVAQYIQNILSDENPDSGPFDFTRFLEQLYKYIIGQLENENLDNLIRNANTFSQLRASGNLKRRQSQ